MSANSPQLDPNLAGGSQPLEYDTQQNPGLGVLGGIIGLLIGAILWALISVLLDRQIGYMAIGVGLLVGIGVRLLGKGRTALFGIVGAVLALIGVLLGNALAVILFASREAGVSVTEVLPLVDWAGLLGEIIQLSEPIDWLFYALAVYAGYRSAFQPGAVQPATS
jgi:hypothetical protein